MTDLVEFIRACLDEDEHLARELSTFAGDGVWRESGGGLASGAYELLDAYRAQGSLSSWHLAHIARHDPARVLREVEAKRQLLIEIQRGFKVGGARAATIYCPTNSDCACFWCIAVRLLAEPYADHVDYPSPRSAGS